jgi:acyl-CoA thioesterase-1
MRSLTVGAGSSCLREDDSLRMRKLMLPECARALTLAFVVAAANGQTTSDLPPVTAAATTAAATTAEVAKKRIVFLGDSLTAGYGVGQEQAFPALISAKIRAGNFPFEVVNAGVSGDTSADGLRRIDWLLQQRIDMLVIALGANDGLRGLPVSALQANLQAIVDKTKAKNPGAQIVIAGMQMPPNLGADYGGKFQRVYADVAQKNNAILIPFLLEEVGGHRDLNQADSIHPTAAGHRIMAETVWRTLEPKLREK